MKFWSCSRK